MKPEKKLTIELRKRIEEINKTWYGSITLIIFNFLYWLLDNCRRQH